MSDSRKVLITGATGAVGPAVVRVAQAQGWDVRTISRRLPDPGVLPAGVDVRTGDVANPAALRPALEGVRVVFHLAGLLHVVGAPQTLRAEYERVNVRATEMLVREALSQGAQRLIMFSTVAVYGDHAEACVHEDTPPRPDTDYARTKLAAERVVLDAARSDGNPLGTVLRLAAVYGPRVKGNYRSLVRMLARRRFVPIGPGFNRRTLVFDEDVGCAALLAASHPGAPGKIFNVTDGTTPTVRDVIDAICAALERSSPRWHVPISPVQGLLATAAAIAPGFGPTRRLHAMVSKYSQNVAVDGGRIRRDLGFAPAVHLQDGWRKTVAALRSAGDI